MKKTPFISVVLTTHHRPELLKRALNSLLSQKIDNFEIIVCADEGSKETKEVIDLLLRPQDSFISAPNIRGPAETRNFGVQIAHGRWVCFLDDDDSFGDQYFKIASELLVGSDSVNFFNYTEIKEVRDEKGVKIIQSVERKIQAGEVDFIEVGNCIPINALFVPSQIAKQNSFDIRLQSHEDWDWLISLRRQGHMFVHHECYGPNIHKCEDDSRNSDSIRSGARALDFLSIYRKWPVSADQLREARANQMSAFGLLIPPLFL